MTAPQPGNPPDPDLAAAQAWAQPSELPVDTQSLHTYDTWCTILALASDILWSASGRRWRNVQASETVTLDIPDGCGCYPTSWTSSVWRYGYGWPILTDPGRPNRVRLPRPDVTAITAASVAGTAFDSYRRSGNWAIRTDGRGWPLSNTTLITYQFGRRVPSAGNLAAILLATELGKAMAGKACQLPARVTSVTRQGISFNALESLEVLKEGLTGIHAIDAWLRAVNPKGTTQQAQVWSPDLIEMRRT
jgi:hypothetical protein